MSASPGDGPRPSDSPFGPEKEVERLWLAWILHLRELLHDDGGFVVRVPGLLPAPVLDRSGYAEHFPQNVLRAVPLEGVEAPGAASGLVVSPASCLHVYARLADGALPEGGVQGVVYGPCGRYEGGLWSESRLSHFTMLEWVGLGTPRRVEELAGEVPGKVSRMFDELGLGPDLVEASDPFFAGERSGPALLQKMAGAKREWRSPSGTALASVNRHGDTYGVRFGIRAEGEPAHSMCVAFGIERLAQEGVRAWGSAPRAWPEELRRRGSLL